VTRCSTNHIQGTNLRTGFPAPKTLKTFTIRFKGLREYPLDVPAVCGWIKHVISLSPIERLNFVPFYQPRTQNPVSKSSWDILTDHLADKHASTLRSFDLRAAFVRKTAMKAIFRKCQQLEEFSVGTSIGSLVGFLVAPDARFSVCSFFLLIEFTIEIVSDSTEAEQSAIRATYGKRDAT